MTRPVRLLLFAGGAVVLAGLLVAGFAGLPDFGDYRGPYGDILNRISVTRRNTTGVVTAINFDFRGFDTLGEEFILFASVVGVTLLLRAQREEEEVAPAESAEARSIPHTSDAVRVAGLLLVGVTVLFGLYVTAHAHLSPGGGFPGGVILASALLLVYLSGEFMAFERVNPQRLVEVGEGAGAGGFSAVGFAAAAAGGYFLINFLPLGTPAKLMSGGTIPILNAIVGLAVTCGFVLITTEFLEQAILVRPHRKP
jgi:multicomponent Na+:H+ antiporter subunit B